MYTSKTIYLIRLYSLQINEKKIFEIHRVLKNKNSYCSYLSNNKTFYKNTIKVN